MVLILAILGCIFNAITIYKKIKKQDVVVNNGHFYFSTIMMVLIPIYVFAFLVPNKIVEGEKDIYTQVESPTGKIYNAMVTFYIHSEEIEEYNYTYYYHPISINWSNGGKCINQSDDVGEMNEWIYFIDQEKKEYRVKSVKPQYTYQEQIKAFSFMDKAIILIPFLSYVYIVAIYIKTIVNNDNSE